MRRVELVAAVAVIFRLCRVVPGGWTQKKRDDIALSIGEHSSLLRAKDGNVVDVLILSQEAEISLTLSLLQSDMVYFIQNKLKPLNFYYAYFELTL